MVCDKIKKNSACEVKKQLAMIDVAYTLVSIPAPQQALEIALMSHYIIVAVVYSQTFIDST